MANQYTKLTADNIVRKINRKKNPVTSAVQLANEFGVDTSYWRSDGTVGSRAPETFVKKVKALVGEQTYNEVRRAQYVNYSYR